MDMETTKVQTTTEAFTVHHLAHSLQTNRTRWKRVGC